MKQKFLGAFFSLVCLIVTAASAVAFVASDFAPAFGVCFLLFSQGIILGILAYIEGREEAEL